MLLNQLDNIVDRFESHRLDGVDLIDVVHNINSSRHDQEILRRWQEWFISKNVPFVVTKDIIRNMPGHHKYVFRIWKKDERLLTVYEIKKERDKGVRWFNG